MTKLFETRLSCGILIPLCIGFCLVAVSDSNNLLKAASLAAEGKFDEAVSRFQQVDEPGAEREIASEYVRIIADFKQNRITRDCALSLMSAIPSPGKRSAEERIAAAAKALATAPDYGPAYYMRGFARVECKDLSGALEDLSRAIDLEPRNPRPHIERGFVYSLRSEYERGVEDYSKAISLDPGIPRAYRNRGSTYIDLAQYDHALTDFAKAIEITPRYANAYRERAFVRQRLGDAESAVQDTFRAVWLEGRSSDLLRMTIEGRPLFPVVSGVGVETLEGVSVKPLDLLTGALGVVFEDKDGGPVASMNVGIELPDTFWRKEDPVRLLEVPGFAVVWQALHDVKPKIAEARNRGVQVEYFDSADPPKAASDYLTWPTRLPLHTIAVIKFTF